MVHVLGVHRCRNGHSLLVGQRVHIDPTARLTRSILWDDVEVRESCSKNLVTDGVRPPAGAVYRRTILVQRRDDGRLQASPLSV